MVVFLALFKGTCSRKEGLQRGTGSFQAQTVKYRSHPNPILLMDSLFFLESPKKH